MLNWYCYSYLATTSVVDICKMNAHDISVPDAVSGTAIKAERNISAKIIVSLSNTFSDCLILPDAVNDGNVGYHLSLLL